MFKKSKGINDLIFHIIDTYSVPNLLFNLGHFNDKIVMLAIFPGATLSHFLAFLGITNTNFVNEFLVQQACYTLQCPLKKSTPAEDPYPKHESSSPVVSDGKGPKDDHGLGCRSRSSGDRWLMLEMCQ